MVTAAGSLGPLRDLAPLLGPLAVIESVRTLPVLPVAFAHAKIVHVMAGRSRVRTAEGERMLTAGDVMVLGGGVWCEAVPSPQVRTWTIYLEQEFMTRHMLWALPAEPERVLPGLHPDEWDGRAVFFRPGEDLFARLEPLWRRMSAFPHRGGPEGVAAVMALFARAVELTVPALVIDPSRPVPFAAGVISVVSPMSPQSPRPSGRPGCCARTWAARGRWRSWRGRWRCRSRSSPAGSCRGTGSRRCGGWPRRARLSSPG